MTKAEALNTLMKMRAWREWGKEQKEEERPEMPEQKEVDEAFDVCIKLLQPSLPPNLDEAANNYGIDIRLGYPRVMDETDRYIYNAFKAGAEWMAGQFHKIEGELVDWYSTSEGKDYCCGIKTSDPFVVPEGFYIRKK